MLSLALLTTTSTAQALDSQPPPAEEWPVLGPMPERDYIREVNTSARGFGLGMQQGFWGSGFAQGLHVDVPFGYEIGQFFGVRLRGLFAHGPFDAPRFDPLIMGGLEPFGRGPVIFGLARIYGGGGVHFGAQPNPAPNERTNFGVSGGGHLGIEIFGAPWMAYAIEVGGQGPIHGDAIDAGAHVMGGIHFYVGG